jgi:ArsR family transcriptional regulator, virulence genes transcriptional regulator
MFLRLHPILYQIMTNNPKLQYQSIPPLHIPPTLYIFNISNMYQKIFQLHSQALKALANPKRLEIIQLLRHGPLCVNQIQAMLDLPQANLSQHLSVLRQLGFLTTTRSGKTICYSVSDNRLVEACDLVREFLIDQHKHTDLADQFAISMTDLTPIVIDPICHMRISPKTASFALDTPAGPVYFCGSACYKKYKQTHHA